VLSGDEGTADCLRLGMKRVLLALCLIGAAPSTTLPIAHAFDLDADDVMSKATLFSHLCVQSTEQNEVHAVIVDVPKVVSLSYASPDTWNELPMSDPPYEQPPATGPLQQLAMSVSD
jgi:hypothetical protein